MKKLMTLWRQAALRERIEFVAQVILYLLISPQAYLFFYGNSTDTAWAPQTILLGLLVTLVFAGSYIAALVLMKNTTSRERWALFYLSFVLIPLPLGLASFFSRKLQNVWASVISAVGTYIVVQVTLSFLFGQYLILLETLVR